MDAQHMDAQHMDAQHMDAPGARRGWQGTTLGRGGDAMTHS